MLSCCWLVQLATVDALSAAVQQRALPAADVADCLLPLALANTRSKEKTDEVSMQCKLAQLCTCQLDVSAAMVLCNRGWMHS
jgi:hypothetical protein